MTIEAHAQAFLTLLDADNAAPALVVHDGRVPAAATPPYVLVYTSVRRPDAALEPDKSSLTFDQYAVRARAICHSVGGSGAAARSVAARVAAALLNVTPSVVGRVCSPIRWVEGQEPARDEATGATYVDVVDVYEFGSIPG